MTQIIDPNSVINRIPVNATATLRLPKEFVRLYDLAHNMWWSWDGEAQHLWSRIDWRQWSQNRNPMSLLQSVDRMTWESLRSDGDFVHLYDDVTRRFDAYMAGGDTWYRTHHEGKLASPVAYLCAEFGVHHTLPFYSGGLGVLAGDHTKAASDLGLPFVGIGLLYRRGYFRQSVDPDGAQQHHYLRVETARRPFREVLDQQGQPLRVRVEFGGREVAVRANRLDVGRVPLLLLDTFLAENDPADRPITDILYVRGREMRLAQEIVLGIGGARVLDELGIDPDVWHINEGHAAFSLLERLSRAVETGMDLDAATKQIQRNTMFTLHTPVPAGNETFDLGLVERYVDGTLPGVPESALRDFGKARDHDDGRFDLGALAIKLSSITNGVSARHGEVVAAEWAHLLPNRAEGVTNGVHPQTWTGRAMTRLYQRALGDDWARKLTTPEAWEAVESLPDADVWNAHVAQKELMLRRLRAGLLEQSARHGASPERLRRIDDQLPAERLTIVFARRFATYKRAGLIFWDRERVARLLTNPEQPVQIIFSGKAHPADREGQGLIRWVVELAQSADLAGHVFFIENYDMQLGRWLATGADVWMNNPTPPLEASGTSGMKAAMNGGLNLSVLDGWWIEGFDGDTGWGFGREGSSDTEDADTLYHLLESEVVPTYFDRDAAGVPVAWVRRMKQAMARVTPEFSAQRMVAEYAERAYLPLA